MPKIIMLPLSEFVETRPMNSLNAFLKEGVNYYSVLWHWFPLPKFLHRLRYKKGELGSLTEIIDHYKRGTINTEEFKNVICARFPKARSHFDLDWNLQCQVTEFTRAAFEEAEILIKEHGHQVYFFSGTNPLHVAHIQQKYGEMCGLRKEKDIPGSPYFSYQRRALGKQLLLDMFNNIKENNPTAKKEDLLCFYTEPKDPYPNSGFLAWFRNPIQKWFYHEAQNYVAAIKSEAQKQGITLVRYEPKGVAKGVIPGILDRIKRLEEAATPTDSPVSAPAPGVTPDLHRRHHAAADSKALGQTTDPREEKKKKTGCVIS